MPGDKSIEHFLRTLRERPRIMALARNPLLLTMIAYLYTDTNFVLPHSRAEFYMESTKLLLDKWKGERNKYKGIHKSLVLRHLAFFNQLQGGTDRRNIKLTVMLKQIRSVLPSLTLKDDDAQPLLDEIVERSGLLLSVDGGAQYQFTHLTLQEYFAAMALKDKPDQLIEYFKTSQDTWREVIRLWCGMEHDSTEFIEKLYIEDSLMAFECLGDTQQVDTRCVTRIVKQFYTRLQKAETDEKFARAFALVAADPRDRGKELFAYLKENLYDSANRLAAATILTLTNLPQAANALVENSLKAKDMYPYLVKMGDLAVQAIADKQYQNQPWGMDILCEIGTPHASLLLVPLLWDDDELVPFHAAWRLAALLRNPNVESALRSYELKSEYRKEKQIEWVWDPFREPAGSALPVITGRIAYLLNTAPVDTIPATTSCGYDPRLVIPLCSVAAREGKIKAIDKKIKKELLEELDRIDKSVSKRDIKQNTAKKSTLIKAFITNHKNKISDDSVWHSLFMGISDLLKFRLLLSLIRNDPTPAKEDWQNVLQPASYIFGGSWQKRSAWVLLLFLCLINIGSLVIEVFWNSQFWKWEYIIPLLSIIIIGVLLWRMGQKELRLYSFNFGYSFFITGIWLAIGINISIISTNWIVGILIGCILGIIFVIPNIIYIIPKKHFTVYFDDVDFVKGAFLLAIIFVCIIVGVFIGGFIVDSILVGIIGGIIGFIGGSVIYYNNIDVRNVGVRNVGVIAFIIYIVFLVVISGVSESLLFYQLTIFLYKLRNWPGVVIFWSVYLTAISFIVWHANRKDRKSRNPLYGLLKMSAIQAADYLYQLAKYGLPVMSALQAVDSLYQLSKYRQKFRK